MDAYQGDVAGLWVTRHSSCYECASDSASDSESETGLQAFEADRSLRTERSHQLMMYASSRKQHFAKWETKCSAAVLLRVSGLNFRLKHAKPRFKPASSFNILPNLNSYPFLARPRPRGSSFQVVHVCPSVCFNT